MPALLWRQRLDENQAETDVKKSDAPTPAELRSQIEALVRRYHQVRFADRAKRGNR